MNTFLIYAPHNQCVKTVEEYEGVPVVYSHPLYYQNKTKLAADFDLVDVNDYLIICGKSDDKPQSWFKYKVQVTSVKMLKDASGGEYNGFQVKVVFGNIIATFFPKISASVAKHKILESGVKFPNLLDFNRDGFKQGAFAELLDNEQAKVINDWIKKDE
ncbi:hypothetical protein AU255_11660 [Methyloprofundus sedimenti]|uniref:Uncharacterized protein n=1 Tax=Methyloprofundus sedimenti TaxID=1420851 RepID=A0A1V8MA50_9GAMM|nr:hypothetical protein [Methyloprofundus sedimenti]OQK18439.1 hypothetical protein AU255_11660 [Methyloprofundus sedimenti]